MKFLQSRKHKHGSWSLTMAAVATFAFSSIAQAIPPGQRDFDTGPVSTFSQSLAIVPNTSVTVNNGSSARDCEQDRGIIRERL